MKVLYFLTGMGIGGIGKFVSDIIKEFDSSIELTTVALGNDTTELANILKKRGKLISCPNWSTNVLKIIKKELHSEKYDVVHVHAGFWSFIILMIAKIEKVPVRIAHSHSADSFAELLGISKVIYAMSRVMNRFVVTHYFACSDHACICTFGKQILKNQKYYRIVNPVDDRFFLPKNGLKIRKEFNIPEEDIVACHVGYFGFHKNHDFILTLAERMKEENVWWILVGNGNKFAQYREMVRDKGLNKVILTGVRSDIPDIFDASDIFVFPSRLEGLGTAVMEAQACGLNCIISENVTKETDVGLGLIEQIKLEDVDKWVVYILNCRRTIIDIEEVKKIYIDKKITTSTCGAYVCSLYAEFLGQRE